MKQIILTIFVGVFFMLFVGAAPQGKVMQKKNVEGQKQMQMMQMMQDSTMVNMMMDHIAKDDHMRMQMMQKMMQTCQNDSSKMMGMCKMMMEDKEMHSMMMKMMGGGMMKDTERVSQTSGKEILIKFNPQVREEQIQTMASEIGMQQIKEIKALNLRVFKITSGKSVEEIIEHCQKQPFVEYAEPNQKYEAQKK